MEFPADFQHRVEGLRDPDAFAQQVLDLLAGQEQLDARAPAFARCRDAWLSLEPELADRYAEAIGTSWATMMARLRPPPELTELAGPSLTGHTGGSGQAPSLTQQQAHRHREEPRSAARAGHKAEIRRRLEAVGLPLLPELFLPEDRP